MDTDGRVGSEGGGGYVQAWVTQAVHFVYGGDISRGGMERRGGAMRGCQECLNERKAEWKTYALVMSLIDQRIVTERGRCDFCKRETIVAPFTIHSGEEKRKEEGRAQDDRRRHESAVRAV